MDDIPSWLRSLRLHKYTNNLSDIKGGVMALAQLSEQDLEKRGVSAVGARRKLLKCFEQVKSGMVESGGVGVVTFNHEDTMFCLCESYIFSGGG